MYFVKAPTQLNLLNKEELGSPLTNNLEEVRHLAGFRKCPAVAKFHNNKFTSKGIRKVCVLVWSNSFRNITEKGFNRVATLLKGMNKR